MKKLLFVAACAALSSVAAASAASPPGPPTTVLNFFDRTTNFVGSPGTEGRPPRVGDSFTFRDEVYRWTGGRPGAHVGHADVLGLFQSGQVVRIEATASLPGGTLEVSGVSGPGPTTQLAVVGGTGRYATARGQLTVRNLGGENSNHSAITIRLWQ